MARAYCPADPLNLVLLARAPWNNFERMQIADISSTSVVDTQQQHRQQQHQQQQHQQHGEEDGRAKDDDGQLKKSMRRASVIIITLSFTPLDTSHIGYQPPLPAEEINPGNGGRGFGRERPGERGCVTARVSAVSSCP